MAILQVLKGLNPGQVIPLENQRSVLGRHPDCTIVLDEGAVSRQHAEILKDGGHYYIEDLHSRNGTQVNGTPIIGRTMLRDDDRVKICDWLFGFHLDSGFDNGPSPGLAAPEDTGLAQIIDDDGQPAQATIMSKLDVSIGESGLRMGVKPEAKLRALLDITESLTKALSVDDVLPKVLDTLFKVFLQADRGFVVLLDENNVLVPKAVKQRRGDDEAMRVSRTIVNQAMESKEAILSADAASDTRFDMSQSVADFRIRSMMCAPLIDSEGHALGVIQIDTLDQRSRFRQEDLDVLASVARQAAFALESAQLHEQALRQKALERDLGLAHKVQRGFLPSSPPQVDGYAFFDFYEPANVLGGDYYDYVSLPNDRLAIVLGDVAGKGIPAALLMVKLSAEMRYCLASEPVPAEAVNRLNATFARAGWEDRFVTLILAVLDLRAETITLVNAGHMPPYLRHHDCRVEAVGGDEAGLPIGIDPDQRYEQLTLPFLPGDCLTMFTDGVSEAMNADGELYGLERLNQQLASQVEDVDALGRQLLDDVKRFVGQRPQRDDICIASFGRVKK